MSKQRRARTSSPSSTSVVDDQPQLFTENQPESLDLMSDRGSDTPTLDQVEPTEGTDEDLQVGSLFDDLDEGHDGAPPVGPVADERPKARRHKKRRRPPGPKDVQRHIQRSEDIFEKERLESTPYEESFLQKNRRHRRNRELKHNMYGHLLDGMGGLERVIAKRGLKKRFHQEYQAKKEHDPDTDRRARNRELKARLKDESTQEYGETPEAKRQYKRNYHVQKEWIGGESEREKAKEQVQEKELEEQDPRGKYQQDLRKERNRALHKKMRHDLLGGVGGLERLILGSGVRDLYLERKEKDPEKVRKDNNAKLKARLLEESIAKRGDTPKARERAEDKYQLQKEHSDGEQGYLEARSTIEEKQRKKHNLRLRTQIEEKHAQAPLLERSKLVQEEYQRKKRLTPEGMEKRERNEQISETKKNNQDLLDNAREETDPELRLEAKRQATLDMGVVDETTRLEKNERLKKYFTRDEYRKLKVHRPDPMTGGDGKNSYKEIKPVVDGVAKIGGGGNTLVGQGAKHMGDRATQDLLLGKDTVDSDGRSFSGGGTTAGTAGIFRGVQGVNEMVNQSLGLKAAVDNRTDPDPAVRALASRQIVDSVLGVAKGGSRASKGILKSIQGFSAPGSDLSRGMDLEGIPIVGLISAGLSLAEACATLTEASQRAAAIVDLAARAKKKKNTLLQDAMGRMRDADLELVVGSTLDIAMSAAAIVENALVLSGIGLPIAAGIKTARSVLRAVRKAAEMALNEAKAQVEQRSIIDYHDALDEGDEEGTGKLGKRLVRRNVKYAVQEIINQARDGNREALDYLQLHGADTLDLSQVSDENLRKLLISNVGEEEDRQTLNQQRKGLGAKLRSGKRKMAGRLKRGVA